MATVQRLLCVSVVLLFTISAIPILAMASGSDQGQGPNQLTKDIIEWVKEQPKQYTEEGEEMPLSGTGFFFENGFPSQPTTGSRTTGRVLNACGSGYTKEGGGTHSYLLIKTGDANYPNASKIQEIIDEFDDVIWPIDTTVFGNIATSKIDICVYTMDGAGGVGGFFAGGDNIYIDAADINGWGYQIMTHEFQHLIHSQHDSNEELWLNEGNSDLAMVLCYGGQASGVISHIWAFQQTPDNDLTQFDNQGFDYGSALAYMTYVWEHFGGNSTVNHLVDNSQNGISSVSSTLSAKGYAETGTEVFFRWTVANIMDDTSFDSGKWGYDEISVKVTSSAKTNFPTQSSGSVHDWAADYVTFTNNGPVQDLKVQFDGGSGSFRAYIAMEGRAGNESKVARMNLDGSNDGEYTVENFGTFGTYKRIHLIIAASNNGGSYSWDAELIDKTPPITTVDVTPDTPNGLDGWYTSKPTVTMSVNEGGTSIYYHWDSDSNSVYSQPIIAPDGEHTLYYHAVDGYNNIEIERGLDLKVDSINPVTSIIVDPGVPDGEESWYITEPSIELKLSEAGNIYYKWGDDGTYQKYTTEFTAPEGVTKLFYYADDAHGNTEKVKDFDFKVDTIVPITVHNLTPETPSGLEGWYTAPPSVTLSSDDDATIYYWWDADPEAEYLGDMIAPEGYHTLSYYAIDPAGNVEVTRSVDIKVDTFYPKSFMTIEPYEPDGNNDWYVTTPMVALELEEDFAASIWFKFDDEDYDIYFEELEIPDGNWVLYWYAVDPAGNMEAEHAEEISVDTQTPVTTLDVKPNKPSNEWYTEVPQMTFDISEEEADIFYHWDYDKETQLTSALLIPEGRHVLYYYAVDEAGNTEVEKSREFRIDTQKPVAILNGPMTGTQGKAVTWDGSSSKDSNGVQKYHFDFGDGQNSGWISSPTTTHTYKKDGTFTVTLKVEDKASLESLPQSQLIKVKKKSGGGGGIFPTDPDDPNDMPIYAKDMTIAGTSFPFWLLLLLMLLVIGTVIGVGVAVRRRNKRKRERMALDMEKDIEDRWRPRDEGEAAYDYDEPPLRATEPYEFSYPSYAPGSEDEIEAVQVAEPLPTPDKGPAFEPVEETEDEDEVPVWTPAATGTAVATKPAPPPPTPKPSPRPEVKKSPETQTPAKSKGPEPAPKKEAPKIEKKGPPEKPKKPKDVKTGDEEIDLDSEINDILGRLDL